VKTICGNISNLKEPLVGKIVLKRNGNDISYFIVSKKHNTNKQSAKHIRLTTDTNKEANEFCFNINEKDYKEIKEGDIVLLLATGELKIETSEKNSF